MTISVDAEYLEELEEKAKRHDFFEGYIKGIEVAFAFAEELVKGIDNRKTESNSEKPNNSTISKMEQVEDEPKTCENCRHNGVKHAYDYACDKCTDMDKFQHEDEPQTCSVNGRPYDCGNCEYHKCTADEPQTERSSE